MEKAEMNKFKERPLMLEEGDFKNCKTLEDIIIEIDKKESRRKKEPQEFYEGRRGGRKKFFFLLQTFYPIFYSCCAIVFYINYLSKITPQQNQILNRVITDWHNGKFEFPQFNNGDRESLPFNDILILPANMTGKAGENKCPTYEEWQNKVNHSSNSTFNQDKIDYINFMDQKWFGFQKGCDCRIHNASETSAKTRKDHGLHRNPCTYV